MWPGDRLQQERPIRILTASQDGHGRRQEDVTAGAHAKANAANVTIADLSDGPDILHPLVIIVLITVEDWPQIGGLNGLETKACLHADG